MSLSDPGRKILVPLTELVEPECLEALIAGSLGLEGAEITLLHVVTVPVMSPLEVGDSSRASKEAARWLKPVAERLEESGFRVSTRVALARDVATGIEESIEGHDLVILPTMTLGGRLGCLLGESSAERLAEKYLVPVIVVSRVVLRSSLE